MPGCDGPTGEEYSKPHHQCIGSNYQTSCDGNQTCFYGFLYMGIDKEAAWFSGRLVEGEGLKIGEPSLLANLGIAAGTIVSTINGAPLADDDTIKAALAPFGPNSPAVVYSAAHLHDRIHLSLSH